MELTSTIFVVDDDPGARETLEALLLPEGYDLAFAASGPEALARLDDLGPDVILLDVMMPDMDGFEVCQRLKGDETWRHIPVILVTALDSKEDLVRGLDAGADEFLSKPVKGQELRARVRSMLRIKKQYDELTAMLQLREDMAGMIVHDMRGPLTAIMGFSQLLLIRSTLPPEQLDFIERINNQAHRLNSFANDLLMVAKMEQDQFILNRSPLDISQLVLEIEESHGVIARSKGINLIVDLPREASSQVSLDANLFERVLDNLLSNAFKFSPPESTVTLRVEYLEMKTAAPSPGPVVRVQVMDEGPGIAAEDRERVFDKFEVVASKQKAISQIGLGLAFCKLVVEAHGGRISVEANEPQGAVLTVEI